MPTKLDDSIIQYARLFSKNSISTRQNHLNGIRKKYKALNKRLLKTTEKKKKLTISEIFSNSNIIIQKDDDISPLKSIKNELIETSETVVHCCDEDNC